MVNKCGQKLQKQVIEKYKPEQTGQTNLLSLNF